CGVVRGPLRLGTSPVAPRPVAGIPLVGRGLRSRAVVAPVAAGARVGIVALGWRLMPRDVLWIVWQGRRRAVHRPVCGWGVSLVVRPADLVVEHVAHHRPTEAAEHSAHESATAASSGGRRVPTRRVAWARSISGRGSSGGNGPAWTVHGLTRSIAR